MITDCHIHIQPIEMFKPEALALIKGQRTNFDEIVEYSRSPVAFFAFLKYWIVTELTGQH